MSRSFGDRALAFVSVTKPEIVTLCGSMRSLAGCVVLLPALPVSDGDTVAPDVDMLATLHRRKIELSDRIHVVNPGNYIGPSTASEIAYAEATGKRVTYEYGTT